METSENIGAIAAAMAKAQGEMKAASKGADNPFFKSKYADLNACFEACREALAKNEIALFQSASVDENWQVNVTTLLAHKSGEWIKDVLPMPVVKKDPQGVGSSISYARRYSLSAMVGLAQADDDGNDGSGQGQANKAEPPAPKKQVKKKPAITKQVFETVTLDALTTFYKSLTATERDAHHDEFHQRRKEMEAEAAA